MPQTGAGPQFLTREETLELVRKLESQPSIILVGGQALNFWAERFRADNDAIEHLAPFQSTDIDYLATYPEVVACAHLLGGEVRYPSPDQLNTPELGVVHCLIDSRSVRVDFLGEVAGLRRAKVVKDAMSARVDGIGLRVMNPLNVLQSRAANVVALRRTDEHSLRQLRTAIQVVITFIARVASQSSRSALDLLEEVAEIAASRDGVAIWADHGIDILEAIRPHEGLAPEFKEKRYPQLMKRVTIKRDKHMARRKPKPR